MKYTLDSIGEAGSALPLRKGKGSQGCSHPTRNRQRAGFRDFLKDMQKSRCALPKCGSRRCTVDGTAPSPHRAQLWAAPPTCGPGSRPSRVSAPTCGPGSRSSRVSARRAACPTLGAWYLRGGAAAVVVVCDADLLAVLGLQLALVETQGALQDVFDLFQRRRSVRKASGSASKHHSNLGYI